MEDQDFQLKTALTGLFLGLMIIFSFISLDLIISTIVVLNHDTNTIISQFEWDTNQQTDQIFLTITIDTPRAGILPKALFLIINMTVETKPNTLIQNETIKFGEDPQIELSMDLTLSQTYRIIRGEIIPLFVELEVVPILAGIKIPSATRNFEFEDKINTS